MASKPKRKDKDVKDSGKSSRKGKPAAKSAQTRARLLPPWYPLVIFMAIGLALRLYTTLWQPLIYPDSTQYMHLAMEIRSGDFFTSDYDLDEGFIKSRHLPPLYSFLIAPFAGSLSGLETVATLVSILASMLTFLPVFFTAAAVFSRRTGFIAAALLSFQAFALFYASPILTEATFTFLFASVIAASVLALKKPSWPAFAACGALSALLYATRDVGITAAPFIAAGAIFKFLYLDRMDIKRTAVLVFALLAAFLAVASPYFIHIRARTGHWGLTVQMENTSITRQIQLFGGDRFDRDRLAEGGTELIGEKPADGFADLVPLIPSIIKKTFSNMRDYGKEIAKRWTPLLTALVLVGIGAIFFDYRRKRDRQQLAFSLWIVLWGLQLWALYSTITPYMVDERYMYPLTVPAVILAAFGVAAVSEWTAGVAGAPDRPNASLTTSAVLLGLAALYVFIAPHFVHHEGFRKIVQLWGGGVYLWFPLAAAWGLFTLAALPGARVASSKLGDGSFLLAGGLALAGAILALALAPDPSKSIPAFHQIQRISSEGILAGVLPRYVPTLLCAGIGAALAAARLSAFRASTGRLPLYLAGSLVALYFVSQFPDLAEVRDRVSRPNLSNKYSAGYREAARDLRAQGLVPPGKVICARKPFIAFYLQGDWYLDKELNEPIPKTVDELKELIASGKIDYLAVDSFTMKAIRPYLTETVFDLEELPNSRLIYSHYFKEYSRIVSVYDVKSRPEDWPRRGSARAHLEKAREYIDAGNMPFAMKEVRRALEYEPSSPYAWYFAREIFRVYYINTARANAPSIAYAPHVLPTLVKYAKTYMELTPGDASARSAYENFQARLEMEERQRTGLINRAAGGVEDGE